MRRRETITLIIIAATVIYVYQTYFTEPKLAPLYTYQVVNKYPHDPTAFTQGLVFHNGLLYEGTGLYGESSLRIVEPETGMIIQSIDLSAEYFGEGITILGEYIYQVTWREQTGYVYDLDLNQVTEFTIPDEGWGLTTDGTHLILSDGTSTLSYIDPATLTIMETVTVTFEGEKINRINELEYIEGYIYSNIWQTDSIAIIDPATGEVVSWIDLTDLKNELDSTAGIDVLNGIAHDPETGKIYVTGKHWPNLFEIKLIPK
jgi:glutamine cyclotransferase